MSEAVPDGDLYMVVERYREGPGPVYARFTEQGRMLPEGLEYVASWVEADRKSVCYQLMRTHDRSLFDGWIAKWNDLVEFDVVPVVTSAEVTGSPSADDSSPSW